MEKERILVIDDELPILMTVSLLLELEPDFEIETLQDATRWRETIERFRPGVMLIDYRMPEMTGGQLIEEMRVSGLRDQLKAVVIFSATPLPEEQLQKIGADAFLEKPFDAEQLISTLREILARRKNSPWLAA